MKKIMWIGFSVQILMIIVMLLLMLFQRQIPDLTFAIMLSGTFACVVTNRLNDCIFKLNYERVSK